MSIDDREARLRDPAHRDQDGAEWHQGRFAERVRREWNPVHLGGVPLARRDLDVLAQAVHARVGGDMDGIRARLDEFAAMEAEGDPAVDDPLVRPGESV